MQLSGIVKEEVSLEQDISSYILEGNEECYQVIATGKQALKDYLFVRKGQKVKLEGKEAGGSIIVEQAKIELHRSVE
ncbi:MAG: hypothetical protein Q4C57_08745 [Bacillota bacterium]|nr:hypothetical protein [Bacillota bacterium]